MSKYFIGAAGALGGMLTGAWLMLAPFALAYQPSGASWSDPTYTDFWSGLPILVVSLIGLITYALGLMAELRRRGVIERKQAPQVQQAQTTPVPPVGETSTSAGDIEQILLPLVAAMLKDMQDRRQVENGEAPQSGTDPNQRPGTERRAQQ